MVETKPRAVLEASAITVAPTVPVTSPEIVEADAPGIVTVIVEVPLAVTPAPTKLKVLGVVVPKETPSSSTPRIDTKQFASSGPQASASAPGSRVSPTAKGVERAAAREKFGAKNTVSRNTLISTKEDRLGFRTKLNILGLILPLLSRKKKGKTGKTHQKKPNKKTR